jgi:glycosyltransferase involved in cell wall biosynthesis
LERSEIETARNEDYKISVLMPTYNDAKYLKNSINSIISQSCKNWELIIVDDGSPGETKEIVETFNDARIKYFHLNENCGQLNALAEAARLVEGEYVTLLHSDDEFSDKNSLARTAVLLEKGGSEGVYADLLKMNENGDLSGVSKVIETVNSFSPALLLLRDASNFVSDVFFVKKEVFSNIVENYIDWNMPYWLKFNETTVGTLDLLKVRPWYKYRVYAENYVGSEIGKFEVTNGCLRTIIEVGCRIDFPLLDFQKMLAKVWSKPRFREGHILPNQLLKMITAVIEAYYGKMPKNAYFEALLGFYSNYPSQRKIDLEIPCDEIVFIGRDARSFYRKLENGRLSDFYDNLLEEASRGFGLVNVVSKEEYQKLKDILRFLNLHSNVEFHDNLIVELTPKIAFNTEDVPAQTD